MAIEKYTAMKNLENVMNSEQTDAVTSMDPVLVDAYVEDAANSDVVEEIMSELEEKATEVTPEEITPVEVKQDNMYTKKLMLDESIEEFDPSKIDGSKDEEDRYLEFDMFDFIYNLFSSQTDSLIRPLKALSNRKVGRGRKNSDDTSAFMYQGSDKYEDELGEKGVEGVNQISTDEDGNVMLYQDSVAKFDDVISLCDEYGLTYEGPTPKKAPWVRWNYSFKVVVPTYADGYPMDVEDYFESRGIPMEEVMPVNFIQHRQKDLKAEADAAAVEVIFTKYVRKAAVSSDPLEVFIKEMLQELADKDIRFNKKALKDRFLAEFNDDFEDEE